MLFKRKHKLEQSKCQLFITSSWSSGCFLACCIEEIHFLNVNELKVLKMKTLQQKQFNVRPFVSTLDSKNVNNEAPRWRKDVVFLSKAFRHSFHFWFEAETHHVHTLKRTDKDAVVSWKLQSEASWKWMWHTEEGCCLDFSLFSFGFCSWLHFVLLPTCLPPRLTFSPTLPPSQLHYSPLVKPYLTVAFVSV